MTIKYIAIVAMIATLFAFLGCTEADPEESTLLEQTTVEESLLASTKAPTAPVDEKVIALEPEPEPEKQEASKAIEKPAKPIKTDAESFEPGLKTVDGLTIQRFVTTSEIEQREPTAQASSFGTDHEKIYAFVEVSNESDSDKRLMVHFIGPDGTVSGGIELEIPPSVPRWRTWAYTRYAKKPGSWRVEIRDVEGSLVGALPFEIEPGL